MEVVLNALCLIRADIFIIDKVGGSNVVDSYSISVLDFDPTIIPR